MDFGQTIQCNLFSKLIHLIKYFKKTSETCNGCDCGNTHFHFFK